MGKLMRGPQIWLYPVPPVLVSCQAEGQPNIITLAWTGVACSNPVIIGVGIRPERYSYDIIKRSGEFVVNLPKASQMEQVDLCGTISGREEDKFLRCGFTPTPGSKVQAPLIAQCPVNLECRVREVLPLGSHHLFLGEVLLVHYDEELLAEGRVDLGPADPLAYAFGRYYRLGEVLGKYGTSLGKQR